MNNYLISFKSGKTQFENCDELNYKLFMCCTTNYRGTMLQAGRSQDRILIRWIFSIDLILPATQWLWG
jgi:hypothetical protein